MSGSFWAEILKLRKRPAVWILGSLWVAVVVLFLYLLPALLLSVALANAPVELATETSLQEQLPVLAPENLVTYLLRFLFPGLGMTVALILGALAAGSEYSWETMKVILSQQPGRLGVLSGKLLALFNLLLLFALIGFFVGGASSLAVGLFSATAPARPPAIELLGGIGVGALILAVWATFGFALATLFRSTALAVGLGLIYSFAVEPALSGLSTMNESVATIARFFPGASTSTLSFAFEATEDPAFSESFLSPVQSALVLLFYIVAFVLIAALVFRRRDVT